MLPIRRLFICVALLLVVPSAGLSAGEVTLIINHPSISPNGDGVKDFLSVSMIVASDIDTLAVTIEDAATSQVYDTVFFSSPLIAGEYSAMWDGTDSLGTPLPEGEYTLRLREALSGTAEEVTRTVIIDITSPVITIDRIEPGTFSPGYPDTTADVEVYYIVSGFEEGAGAHAMITGPSGGGTFIPLDVTGDGESSLEWKPGAGSDAGLYTIELTIEDEAGNSTSDSGVVEIDTDGPVVSITTEVGDQVQHAPVVYQGYCHDRSGVLDTSLAFSWASYDASGEWSEKDYPQSDTTWVSWWQSDTLFWLAAVPDSAVDGNEVDENDYTLKVSAEDSYGQKTTAKLDFTVDRTPPDIPYIVKPPGRVIEPSLSLTLTYDAPDTDSLVIYRRHESVTDSVRVLDDKLFHKAQLEPGVNEIWVRAIDRAGNTSGNSNLVTVTYAVEDGVTFPEVFRGPDVIQIITTDMATSVEIDLYDLGGERVRRIVEDGPGTSFEIEWDLTNDSGDAVRNGPLLMVLRIRYDTYSTLRKNFIAVVR